VSRAHQRLGLGTELLKQGLREVDKRGLQCVLGASPEGKGLYEKFGFRVTKTLDLDLEKYEGGEGYGVVKHSVMHRPVTTL